jgi:lambda family phage tail tape measure protein
MAGLGDLVVKLSAETAQFNQALDKASYQAQRNFDSMVKSAKTAGFAIAGAFAVGQLVSFTRQAIAYADQIADVAKANEVGAETVLALGESLRRNGGEAENAGKMFSSFTSKVYQAVEGSRGAQDAFKSLGITTENLSNMSMIELFDSAIDRLGKMQDSATRNGLAMELFGKAAKGVDFVGLSQGTDELRQSFMEYAMAIQSAADLQDKFEVANQKLTLGILKNFVPTMTKVAESASQAGSAFNTLLEFGGEAFKGLVYGVRTVVTALQTVNASVNLIGLTLSDIGSGKFNTFFDRLREYDAYVAGLRIKDKEFARELANNAKESQKAVQQSMRTVKDPDDAKSQREAEKRKKAIADSIELANSFAISMEQMASKAQLGLDSLLMSESEVKLRERLVDISKAYADAQAKLAKEFDEGFLSEQVYLEQSTRLIETYKEAIDVAEQFKNKQDELNSSIEYGATVALTKYVNESKNVASLTQGVVTGALKSLDDAMFGIISRTTSVSDAFRNMTASILADIAKIMIRQTITAPIANALSGAIGGVFMGGGSSVNLGTQSLGTGGSTGFGVNPNASLGGIRADGGLVQAGKSYLVGEKGAELFTPFSGGNITKSEDIGGTVVNQTINIQTGVAQTVRTEIQSMMPRIMEATKAAVADSKRRGGTYGRMMA